MCKTVRDDLIEFNVTDNTPDIRFIASLSDGRSIIQDERPRKRHAWVRLCQWLTFNKHIQISNLRLQAPDRPETKMPPNQKGYFFGNKQYAVWGGSQSNYLGIGYYDGQKVNIIWFRQDKFDHAFSEERTAANAGFFLIKNHS